MIKKINLFKINHDIFFAIFANINKYKKIFNILLCNLTTLKRVIYECEYYDFQKMISRF